MKLDEFIDQQKKKVKAFERFWEHNHEEDAEEFPLELDETEWDEHFHLITIDELVIDEE